METANTPKKIRRLSISNYKGIDSLEIDFPPPKIKGDPDIIVMGSRNGLGKTSVIECCALLLLTIVSGKKRFRFSSRTIDIPDLLIKAGSDFAEITGEIAINGESIKSGIKLRRNGTITLGEDDSQEGDSSEIIGLGNLVTAVCGFEPNPLLNNSVLLFHSYRQVSAGNPEFGAMIGGEDEHLQRRIPPYRRDFSISNFKMIILRSLMGKAGLFDVIDVKYQEESIDILNSLIKEFADAAMVKLHPLPDNTINFRVIAENGNRSFAFDGLSSGQKEIISTLFLIWYQTKNNPSVVFIDEPELHFNAQWHRDFVNKLLEIAPHNQYIMATHSEDIMDSVAQDRRIILRD
jgi:predicted ATPase